ncbi:MAG: hypothetical protein A2Y62_05340 [Candidatus Fischerbacteria bacterium RBG_13_37_8]|uniref:Uncharacterized protein n=1 Tax=Candidatus Fischerbacteria bacterium RBG_13_37_8 TaxID=1817863 RepID=A0A1F5VXI6_9BACT|nr:MAG: hypothetical protein A2Y62_05340 [Candidatus Fischerbacteria bacterium RBG_13_37_8]
MTIAQDGTYIVSGTTESFGSGDKNILVLKIDPDGMFYCIVGLLLIAFTEHWQRVGDLAASTIVIKKE